MAVSFRDVLSEAKKNKHAQIWNSLSDDEVVEVWDEVSSYIKKSLSQQKGVSIPGLGTFAFTQIKLDVGNNNKSITTQRPVFIISEKFAKTHGLKHKLHNIPGGIPVTPLNLSQISLQSQRALDRDTVDACVREMVNAMSRCVADGKPVEFSFAEIGRLLIRDSCVKMKFFKSFIQMWDNSGQLVVSLQGRPSTADSVMSEAVHNRSSSVIALPRLDNDKTAGLASIKEDPEENADKTDLNDFIDSNVRFIDSDSRCGRNEDNRETHEKDVGGNSEGRTALAVPKATTFCWDSVAPITSPSTPAVSTSRRTPLVRSTTSGFRDDFERRRPETSSSAAGSQPPQSAASSRSSVSSCGHNQTGQELCYVCHQRERRNVYVSFDEERRKREEAENQLLHEFQKHRNAVSMQQEQEKLLQRRFESQQAAVYNLSAAEVATAKKQTKDQDYHPSFLFRKRALTPPNFLKRDRYRDDLDKQVKAKEDAENERKKTEEIQGRLEQVQLAEDIAAQREYYERLKVNKVDDYRRGLSAQLKLKAQCQPKPESPELLYFASDIEARDEALVEKRRLANELFREQVALVEQQKRDAILKRFEEQRHDDDVLTRNKHESMIDAADRYERMMNNRRSLEEDWRRAVSKKRERDGTELVERMQPETNGVLDQCKNYRRCGQCRRRLTNKGQTNVWCESRYIPGCRIMV